MPKQSFPEQKQSNSANSGSERYVSPNIYPVFKPNTTRAPRTWCARCKAAIEPHSQFCVFCGQKIALSKDDSSEWLKARPWLAPRLCAEITDRLFPFAIAPVIAMPMMLIGLNGFFWTWISVVFLWHLLRDCSANRRSLGKRCFRLRVVSVNGRKQIAWPRVIIRRILSALSQCAYYIAIAAFVVRLQPPEAIQWPWPLLVKAAKPLLLLAFGYDVVSIASILITAGGRRIEDFIARTRVVREAAYTLDRKKCGKCGALILKTEIYCGRCGERSAPKINIRPVE